MIGLSTRIRQARLRTGMTQAELARRVGVKRSAATQWEHPAGTVPCMEHLIAVALATGVYLEWLATGRGSQCDATDGAGPAGPDDADAWDDDIPPARVLTAARGGNVATARDRTARRGQARADAAPTDALERECLALLRALPESRRRMALRLLRALRS